MTTDEAKARWREASAAEQRARWDLEDAQAKETAGGAAKEDHKRIRDNIVGAAVGASVSALVAGVVGWLIGRRP